MPILDTGTTERSYFAEISFLEILVTVLFLFSVSSFRLAYAQDSAQEAKGEKEQARFELQEVVVTGTPIEEPIKKVPKNVTVITGDDIKQAPSNNVVDLLAREANVNLNSFFGHDKNASIDIRGQGINATSNVIILVDGFRLNPPDLAGPDLSTVPLDQIERIEIVRGASSVIYGNGAVGGVINIITKKGEKKPALRLYSSYGSYETFDGRASTRGRMKNVSFNLEGDYYDTDGYRDNGFYRKKDMRARIGYDVRDVTRLSLSTSYHQDEQGFPGNIPLEDIESRSKRRKTRTPNDSGETTDWRFVGELDSDLGKWGSLKLNGGYRLRDNDFILGFTPLKSRNDQESHIDENTLTMNLAYNKEYEALKRKHSFQFGIDYYYTDYISERPDERIRKNSVVQNLGAFFMNQWALLGNVSLSLGYRLNSYDGEFRNDELQNFDTVERWINGKKFDRGWDNDVFDSGIVYSPTENTIFFASYATTFRVPNVDELALAAEDLRPQKGNEINIGVRHKIEGLAEISLTTFQTEIANEIFFDGGMNINRNLEDKTRRRGVELDVKFYPTDSLYLWGNYTYMEAKFKDIGTFVPLVPKNTASIGLEWHILEPLVFAVTGSWVDSKFDGNDLTNDRFEKIDAYAVVDTKVTYTHGGLRLFGGINNIFDELYETLAFSESYFTMPTRNYSAGLEWRF